MGGSHHPLSASKAALWARCTGFYALSPFAPPDTPSKFAAEGTAAHSAAEEQLRGYLSTGKVIEQALGTKIDADGMQFEFNENMRGAVRVYINFIVSLVKKHNLKPGAISLESRVTIPTEFENAFPEIGPLAGRLDVSIFVAMNCLYAIDYKHGAGVPVSVEGNEQLLFYALGKWLELTNAQRAMIEEIKLVIVQPRVYTEGGIKIWSVTPDALAEYHTLVKRQVERIIAKDFDLVPGSHCKNYFCHNRTICDGYKDYASALPVPSKHNAANDFASILKPTSPGADGLPQASVLSNDDLGRVLRRADDFAGFIKLCEEEAFRRINLAVVKGETGKTGEGIISGVKLKPKKSNRQWGDETKVRDTLIAAGFKESEFSELSVLSFTKIEKVPSMWKHVKDLVIKPDNGMTLEVK